MSGKFLTQEMKSYIRALLQDGISKPSDAAHELLLIEETLCAVDSMEAWAGTSLPAYQYLRRHLNVRKDFLKYLISINLA